MRHRAEVGPLERLLDVRGSRGGRAAPWHRWRARLRRWRRRLRRWRERSPERRRLLVRAAVLVLGFRAALRLLPFARVLAAAERLDDGRRRSASDTADPATVGREVEAAARVLAPDRPCLSQALACCVLLRRAGQPAHLRIGVRRSGDASPEPGCGAPDAKAPGGAEGSGEARPSSALEAHAWVECRGRIVAGGEAVERAARRKGRGFAPLLARSAEGPDPESGTPREGSDR